MAVSGILTEDSKVELINGEVINKSSITCSHAGNVNFFSRRLITKLGMQASICIQNPLRLTAFSEPEPDITVAKYRKDEYEHNHPTAGMCIF